MVSEKLRAALRAKWARERPLRASVNQRPPVNRIAAALRAQEKERPHGDGAEQPATTRHVFLESSGRDDESPVEIDEAAFRSAVVLRSEHVGIGAIRHSAIRQGRHVSILQQLREADQ